MPMPFPFYSLVLGQEISQDTVATHPVTGEQYGGSDWTDPVKLTEVQAVTLRYDILDPSKVLDHWEYGDDPDDITDKIKYPVYASIVPAPTEAETEAMKAAINVERERRLNTLKVSYNGVLYDADGQSRMNIIALLVAISTGMPVGETVPWRAADNVTRMLTPAELKTIGSLILYNVQVIYNISWYLKDTLLPSLTPLQFKKLDVTNDAYWTP